MKFLADYSPAEQAALKTQIFPEFSDEHINYVLRVCDARKVDPFSGLLYAQKRTSQGKVRISIQPTADGSRAQAAKTGEYAGSTEPEYDSEENAHPNWCRVTVFRIIKGERCAFTAKVRWKEFVPQAPNDFQWKAKPYHMLGKVAEVQALRKAFPEHVPAAGEDDYGEVVEAPQDQAVEKKSADAAKIQVQFHNAVAAFKPLGKTEENLLVYLGKLNRQDLTEEDMEKLQAYYQELQREKTA